ncbi:MAG TPA: response regulator [Rhodocyclaceae bacterium]|nr:response regulator [Rhodocyclaceae bacterium]
MRTTEKDREAPPDGNLCARSSAAQTVLYYHDDQARVGELRAFLERRFARLLIAEHDFAALALLRRHLPDLVVADLTFCTGHDLLLFQALRQLDPAIPLLIATPDGDRHARLSGLDPRPTRYLERPIDIALLASLLDQVQVQR